MAQMKNTIHRVIVHRTGDDVVDVDAGTGSWCVKARGSSTTQKHSRNTAEQKQRQGADVDKTA